MRIFSLSTLLLLSPLIHGFIPSISRDDHNNFKIEGIPLPAYASNHHKRALKIEKLPDQPRALPKDYYIGGTSHTREETFFNVYYRPGCDFKECNDLFHSTLTPLWPLYTWHPITDLTTSPGTSLMLLGYPGIHTEAKWSLIQSPAVSKACQISEATGREIECFGFEDYVAWVSEAPRKRREAALSRWSRWGDGADWREFVFEDFEYAGRSREEAERILGENKWIEEGRVEGWGAEE